MNKRISTYVAFAVTRRNLFWCAGVLAVLCNTMAAQIDTLHLFLPDAFGKRGVTYAYPVQSLDSLTTLDSIYSGEFTIQQNTPAVVDVVSIDTIGTILSGVSSVYYNSVNNKIVFAHTQPITGNGVLFYLLIQFKANASGTKTFTLINNLLNEGQPWDPIVAVDPGSLRPMDIFINPKNPPQDRVVGDTLIFSVTGDVTLPITWMVSDTSVASIDSLGMLIGKNVGQTVVSVTDAQGLSDQSTLLPIHPASLRNLTVTVPDTSIMQNLVFDLPIRVSDVTSLGIVSAQFSLSYNQTILKPVDVINAGTLTQTWSQPVVNYGNGTMQVALAGADTLTGSGTLVYVRFKVARFASFGTSINLSNVLFNENLNATIDDGFFSPFPGPVITIPNFPFGIMRNETALLTASGGTAPYKWFVASDTSIANIDSVNGMLTTKKSGFLKVTVIDFNGFDKSESTYVADARITFPDTSFIYTDTIDVPVIVSDLNGLSVLSGQMKFNYDSTKIRLQQVVQTGTMTAPMLLEWKDSLGNVRIAFSGSTSLAGSGVLMKLRFISTSPLSIGFNQILMANEVFFNEPGPEYRFVTQKFGTIAVLTKPNTPPVFTNKLRDTTITENQFFTFQLQATDADGDSIIFGIFNVPPGMSFNPKTGLITWTPSFTQAGTYKLNYDVGDFYPDGVVKDSAIITVLDGNRPPVFTQAMTNTTINEDQLFTFDINATDPDGDIVRYYIGNIQPGMNIDTVTGLFNWKPSFMQAGVYNLTQVISDGRGGLVNQPFTMTVQNIDRLPFFTKTLPDTSILAGQAIQYSYEASDPDSTPVSFSLNEFPTGATITPAGLFSWTPLQNQAGTFRIVVSAVSTGSVVRDTAFITVNQTNQPPVFVSVLPNTTIAEGQTLTFNYQASDPDNDTLVWTFQAPPPSGMNITAGGLLTWTPSFTQAGSYQIIVRVSDKSFTLVDTALVTVTNTNLPPAFTAVLPDTTIYADSLFSFSYKGGDPDGDSISFALTKSPAGAIITAKGNLSWVPTLVRKDTFVVSISDGSLTAVDTAIVSVTGFPKLQTAIFELDFGTTIFGTLPKKEITIKNIGVVPLVLNRIQGLPGENNFSVDAAQQVTLNVQEEKVLMFTYTPENIGTHIGGIAFQTNDPKQPVLGVLLKGTAISKSTLKKKILVDNAHNSAIPLRDSIGGMTQLFSALKSSGFTVSFAETTLAPAGFDAVLIVTPQKDFSQQEKSLLRQYVSEGGLIVMMGNEGVDSTSNSALNKLLQDTVWTTGLLLGKNLVTDSTNNYFQNPQFPVISQFTDTAHPYLRSIDTLVLFGSSSVLVTGNGIPFARFTTPSVTVTGGTTQAAIGLSEIGKGKLLLFGDATTWLNGFSAQGSFNIDAQDNLAFALNVFSVTEDYEVKLPSATPNERYQLVSIPFDLDNADIASVLKDLGGVNPLIWRLFGRYNPAAGQYAEFPSAGFNSFRRGEAYWLITRGQFNLNFGSATITAAQDFFPIRIGPGYSMIGNPFPYKVSWKDSRKGDSVQTVAWTYNGSTFVPESLALESFTGYFVKNLSKDSVTIYINPMDISTSPLPKSTATQTFGQNEWRISIRAYSGNASDEINYAGVAQNAERELDAADISEPPATPTDYVIVRFNNKGWNKNAGNYAVDIRPLNDEGEFWDLEVITAKKQSKVKLSLTALGDLPADFEVYIIDKQSEIAKRIVNSNDYEFAMGKNEVRRAFRLVVGKNSFVKENTGGIPLVPQNFALRQNYPNPFNPTTLIQYTLGRSGDVSVAIFNILGQRVRTLRNEFQSIGTYSIDWDGKDESGSVVASGVYFYKITVMSNGERLFAETKKMVLMK